MPCRKLQSVPLRPHRCRERLDHAHLALRKAVLPFVLDAVRTRSPRLHRRPRRRRRTSGSRRAPALGVGETMLFPPALVAREHPRPLVARNALVDRRKSSVRLVGVDEPDRAGRRSSLQREARPVGLRLPSSGAAVPVAEAAVDRCLRGPERRDRLAPAVHVLELARIRSRRIPRRRCVGSTPTQVTPAQGSCHLGIDRSNL